jgi:hypothetical protein
MSKQFATPSLYLAAFLRCRGTELEAIDRDERTRRGVFIFRDTEKRKKLSNAFLFGKDDDVSAKGYMEALKGLKAALYDGE